MGEGHKCAECVYIAWRNIAGSLCEVDEYLRNRGAVPKGYSDPFCAEDEYNLPDEISKEPMSPWARKRVHTVIHRPRLCSSFDTKQSGTSSSEYRAMKVREMQKQLDDAKQNNRWLIGILIGLASLLIPVIIYLYTFSSFGS